MIDVTSNDVDRHLTPDIMLSWITTEWVAKPIPTDERIMVSGGAPIFNDMKWLTHDEHVSLKQPLTEDQTALVLYRVAHDLKQYDKELRYLQERNERLVMTARRMHRLEKGRVKDWEAAELLGIPTED